MKIILTGISIATTLLLYSFCGWADDTVVSPPASTVKASTAKASSSGYPLISTLNNNTGQQLVQTGYNASSGAYCVDASGGGWPCTTPLVSQKIRFNTNSDWISLSYVQGNQLCNFTVTIGQGGTTGTLGYNSNSGGACGTWLDTSSAPAKFNLSN